MPQRRGLRPRLLAAVIRSNATLAFAAERQVVSQTVHLPPPILAKVREAIADLDDSFDWGRLGRQLDAIPLVLTIGSMVFLRSDGTFLVYQGDPLPERLIRETDEADTLALAWGMERYSWLSALFPSRPVDARNCPACGGTGRLGRSSDRGSYNYCLSCDALGWVSAG
jgi:hypothetical protein